MAQAPGEIVSDAAERAWLARGGSPSNESVEGQMFVAGFDAAPAVDAVGLAHLERGAELLIELYGAQLHLTKGRQIERAKSDRDWIEAEVARQEKKEQA